MNAKTVFVLGAGASSPFGFPTGLELLKKIINDKDVDRLIFRYASYSEQKQVEDFREALYFSGLSSVDAFLQWNKEFLKLGKILIGWYISTHESSGKLLMISEKDIDVKRDSDRRSWYREIWKRLSLRQDLLVGGQISFVTFNYDRSLEHFLELCFKHCFYGGKNIDADGKQKLVQILNEVNIIHTYGQLGFLDWQKDKTVDFVRPYHPLQENEFGDFIKICQQLDLVRENSKLPVGMERARKVIKDAEMIYFLGFGYDETNMQLLGLMDGVFSSTQLIGGTTLGLGKSEISRIESYFTGAKSFASLPIDEYIREEIDWSSIL